MSIKKFESGSEDDTILDADRANELVDAANAFLDLKIIPEGAGVLTVTEGSATLELKGSGGGADKIRCLRQNEDGSLTVGTGEVSNFVPDPPAP